MATEKIVMPQLGESVTEGTISKWLVAEGDRVKKYEPIAEVMTDKVTAEIPSSFTGTIQKLVIEEGETVEVGELIGYIETEEAQSAAVDEKNSEPQSQQAKELRTKEENSEEQPMKKRYSPAVLRLAQTHEIDLEKIEGSGRGGRITRKDVEKAIAEKETAEQKAPAESVKSGAKSEKERQFPEKGKAGENDVEIPVSGVRRAIAENMVKSKREAPHAWTMVECDVTELVNYRNSIKKSFFEKEGYPLTYLPFFIKAVVDSLKQFPQLNAMWAGDKIIQKKDIHISIAVATNDALFVPVIHHADELSIKGIARKVHELSEKVRNNRLTQADMEGGTFTVNNTGSFGSILSQPIINPPQAAILSVESIVKRPVVRGENTIAIRDLVNLCLSLDHRVLDGLVCGRFLKSVRERLETYSADHLSLY